MTGNDHVGLGRLLRQREVLHLLGVHRVTLWEWRRRGVFPRPLRIGPNTLAWRYEDIEAWRNSRPLA